MSRVIIEDIASRFPTEKPKLKTIDFQNYKHGCFIYTSLKNALNRNIVNQTCYSVTGRLLKITFKVPLTKTWIDICLQ